MTTTSISRIAVVTGATSGIGAATAIRLAADGAAVALLGRRTDRLAEGRRRPGIVGTDLGDAMRDDASRAGLAEMRAAVSPLVPEDIADAIGWSVSAPANVNIAEMVVVPVHQG